MTVRAYPFDSTDAAGTVTELEWRRMMQWIMPSGVLRGEGNGLAVTQRGAGANMSVDVASGDAMLVGTFLHSDAVTSVAVANNATGNPRIDTVVVGVDFAANTGSVYLLPGVAAAAPAPAAVTQDITTKWEEVLAYLYVAAGENVSIDTAEISDARHYAEPVAQTNRGFARLATTAALGASTVTGITDRVANANGALGNIDSVAPAVGDVILDKDTYGPLFGPWRVVDLGSASKPWRMRRAYFADTSAKVRSGMALTVTEGTAYAGSRWTLTTNDPIVLGTTVLIWSKDPSSARVGCSVKNAGATAYNPGTSQITWDTELLDTDAYHSGGFPSGMVIPGTRLGWYRADITIDWTNGVTVTSGPLTIWLRQSATSVVGAACVVPKVQLLASGRQTVTFTRWVKITAGGEYLEVLIQPDAGNSAISVAADSQWDLTYVGP